MIGVAISPGMGNHNTAHGFVHGEWLLEDFRVDSKSGTSQNRYSAQTFIYLR
jgi:hypothetical protein